MDCVQLFLGDQRDIGWGTLKDHPGFASGVTATCRWCNNSETTFTAGLNEYLGTVRTGTPGELRITTRSAIYSVVKVDTTRRGAFDVSLLDAFP